MRVGTFSAPLPLLRVKLLRAEELRRTRRNPLIELFAGFVVWREGRRKIVVYFPSARHLSFI
jgi:hypothetical protein